MCVVAATVGGGIAASAAGSAISGAMAPSGGGGGGGSLGAGLTGILSGADAMALGISGLSGQNLSYLETAAAAANPFGSQSQKYYGSLEQIIGNGSTNLVDQSGNILQALQRMFTNISPNANISTNTGALSNLGNISTPGQNTALQGLLNNPTQLLQTLQGGGVQTPSNITALANQNPAAFTPGEQFQFEQGLGALNRTQAAQGLTNSGAGNVALEEYGQNFASQAYQQNVNNMFGAQQSINQTAGVNQGLQQIVNQMGQTQFGNTFNLAQLLQGQQQATFGNQLGTQQLQSTQQQNTMQNLNNLLSQYMQMEQIPLNTQLAILPALLTATQASNSSPASAGAILGQLPGLQQQSAGNIASGIGGLTSGIGNLLGGLNFGGGGATGSFGGGDFSGAFTSNPYYSGGGNSFGFAMPSIY